MKYVGNIELTVNAISAEHAKRLIALAAVYLEENREYVYRTMVESVKEVKDDDNSKIQSKNV